MTIRVQLRTLWKHRWILATAMCAGASMAIALAVRQPPVYLAQAQIFITPDARDGGEGGAGDVGSSPDEELAPYAAHIESLAMAQTVVRRESLDIAASELAGKVETEVLPEIRVVSIGVADSDASQARNLSNAFATAFVEEGVRQVGAENVQAEVLQAAPAPQQPVSPKPVRDGVIGLGVGALAGAFFAFILRRPASKGPERKRQRSSEKVVPIAPPSERPPRVDLKPASRTRDDLLPDDSARGEIEPPGWDDDEPPLIEEEELAPAAKPKDPLAIYPATRTFLGEADRKLSGPTLPYGDEDSISQRIREAVRRGMTAAASSEAGSAGSRAESKSSTKRPRSPAGSQVAKEEKQRAPSSEATAEPDVEFEEFWEMGREHDDPAENDKLRDANLKKKRPKA